MEELDLITYLYEMFLKDGLLIVVACYVIGNIITRCVPKINNNNTVPILSILGAILMIAIPSIYAEDPMIVRIIKGIILGWSSTGLHELFKSLAKSGVIKLPGYKLVSNITKESNSDEGVG